jgi:hypothetical protein
MEGLKQDPNYIDLAFREMIWQALGILTDHPDPTREYEERHIRSIGPQTLSLNTVRGKAMHAVVAYAWWVYKRRNSSQQQDGFIGISEAKNTLEAHLDIEREPSLAVRSVYGQWFPRLFAIDRKWCMDNRALIFPNPEVHSTLWEAAWTAYLVSWGIYMEVFQALRAENEYAVEVLDCAMHLDRALGDPKAQLAAHLMALVWSDRISIEDPLLVRFWLKASPQVRRSALETIGRWLHAKHQEFDTALLERLIGLWNSRFSIVKQNQNIIERSMELEAFSLWFGSGKFSDEWAIAQFAEILEWVDPAEMKRHGIREEVVTRLVDMADRFTLPVVKSLGRLIGTDKFGWDARVYERQFSSILSAALRRQGETAQIAEGIINHLWSSGYKQYGALLGAPV